MFNGILMKRVLRLFLMRVLRLFFLDLEVG